MNEKINSLKSFTAANNSTKKILIFSFIALFVLILIASFFSFSLNRNTDSTQDDTQTTLRTPLNISNHTLVYGTWSGNNSLVKAIDLKVGSVYLLASLPSNIKKITVLNNDQLLYIDETNVRDQGKRVSLYTISTQSSTPLVESTEEFLIDDYEISLDKSKLVLWETQINSDTNTLIGGKSRVYGINLSSPSVKHLIYDEIPTSSSVIHQPIAVTNNGKVYSDTFVANAGAQWGSGISIANLDGSEKNDLENMSIGTISTQPVLSPDGTTFVFAGYDGSQGDGKQSIDGQRRAIKLPNTIELLHTADNRREKLSNFSNQNLYPVTYWDVTSGKIIYMQILLPTVNHGMYAYDINNRLVNEIEKNNDPSLSFVASLSEKNILTGKRLATLSGMGNLGNSYSYGYTDFSVLSNTGEQKSLDTGDSLMQFISLVPSSYFTQVPESLELLSTDTENRQLQHLTFELKPSLAPQRLQQQSGRTTLGQGTQECMETVGSACPMPPSTEDGAANISHGQCMDEYVSNNPTMLCLGHPLYLYGAEGKEVKVSVHTPVYDDSPEYTNGYHVTLLDSGLMKVNGEIYNKINFSYQPSLKRIIPPSNGTIVKLNEVGDVLQDYGKKLGLNAKEIKDLITFGKNNVISPYVFISFFDHTTSQAILPVSFSPQPDVYRNIVFYFKQLSAHPGFTPDLPHFEKIERKGFTAVEISEIVE